MKNKIKRRIASPVITGYLFLAPSIVILCLVGFYPLIKTVILSFYNVSLTNPGSHFVGFKNYLNLADDIWFKVAYKNTWYFTVLSVIGETIFGLLIALLLDKNFSGRRWIRASILVPWAIPTVVSANMWEWLYNSQYGVIDYLMKKVGFIDTYQNWLGNSHTAMMCAIVADIWKTTPFMALIILSGLQTVSEDIYEGASIDGASHWQKFRYITLPLLTPTILTAVLLRALDAFRVFDLIFVLTGGGPANSTEVLSTYAYKTTFSSTQVSYGSAMSMVMALSVLLLAIFMLWVLKRTYERLGA